MRVVQKNVVVSIFGEINAQEYQVYSILNDFVGYLENACV